MNLIQTSMQSQYTITVVDHLVTMFQIKDGHSFPYRVCKQDDGTFRLAQSFSPRVGIKETFKKIADFATYDEALLRIIKRHNKSCSYMGGWTKIETN